MFAAFKRQIREEYEERMDVQQRQTDDFQRRHVEEREDHRAQQRQNGRLPAAP
jgi:hypothetical protein